MNILLDLMGSTIIGGLIVSMIINFNVFQSNSIFSSDSELQLQQNAKTLAEILNHDFRKIGYRYDNTAFVEADSERISFYSDVDRDGNIDLVTYMLGDTTEVSGTTNPRDRILYRIVNSDTISGPSLGLTKAKFSYFNGSGVETTTLSEIQYVKAELWIETIERVDGGHPFTYWELTINPRNL
jgi:hypothetical protein